MVETKSTKVKSKKLSLAKKKENKSTKQRLRMHEPNGVIQRIKPRKREVDISKGIDTNSMNDLSEEFDSDEHVENDSDWHDDLDVIRMPHLLGPSATKHSPVPIVHQHLSIPPFGCYKLLIQCNQFQPIVSYVPC